MIDRRVVSRGWVLAKGKGCAQLAEAGCGGDAIALSRVGGDGVGNREKQEEYEALQVPEFWIVDYRGQIPAKYCQRGKGKKVIVLTLVDGVYRKAEYVEGEAVPCLTFPELSLTVEQILAAEE